jgi:hypothetical protein
MAPKTRCVLALVVPFSGRAFLKELICKDAGLGKTIHPLLNINVDPSVRSDNATKIVDNAFFGGDFKTKMHVLRDWHGGVGVEIGKVSAQNLCPWGTDGGIDE